MLIYKILRAGEWAELQAAGSSAGAPVDVADGYIHFSTAAQLRGTAAKHFAGEAGLMLLCYEAEDLGPALRWEEARGGALFPHLYAPLPLAGLVWSAPLPLDGAGTHVFPGDLA
ncbi:DUF952 domain-containing protein [Salipiger marinus]|uniref:DUF952 domain-containing protein n=1 Tax=Salipiger marinus TaxID=555512 RepID=UPI000E9C1DCE|nr:DUF952 domain-containing protein [Salipiger manganoxidans]MCD1618305.1 DUF952 domain-containing protein [Salipiger manganoxidans]MEB3418098.1 DUF952 domain-containing protein [Salipiger manganoxidans]HBT00373.1 DUF952 domain-containing protein [Citreicella sp.]